MLRESVCAYLATSKLRNDLGTNEESVAGVSPGQSAWVETAAGPSVYRVSEPADRGGLANHAQLGLQAVGL